MLGDSVNELFPGYFTSIQVLARDGGFELDAVFRLHLVQDSVRKRIEVHVRRGKIVGGILAREIRMMIIRGL